MAGQTIKRRLADLEKRLARRNPEPLYICWCGTPDGQHEPECAAFGAPDGGPKLVLYWDDANHD